MFGTERLLNHAPPIFDVSASAVSVYVEIACGRLNASKVLSIPERQLPLHVSYHYLSCPMLRFMAQNEGNPSISIPVGITVGLIASFVQSLGLTIQRKSHVLNQKLPESERKVEHRRP